MQNDLETKLIKFEIKAGDGGSVEGYGAVFGNVDHGGDIVAPGAFDESIKSGRKVMMLRGHRHDQVIGVWDSVKEDHQGLRVAGRFALNTQLGKETHELVKMGAFDGLSIGYRTIEEAMDGKARIIKKAELWEVSAVTFPMNTAARIDAVKAATMTERDFERLLTQDAGLSRSIARALMRDGLKAVSTMQDAGTGLDELAAYIRSLNQPKKENCHV